MAKPISTARQHCEDYLRERTRKNIQGNMLGSETKVAEALLKRGDELAGVYEELIDRLSPNEISWQIFLDCVLYTAALWSPEKINKERDARNELVKLNKDIAQHAETLADLLARRDYLHNHSAFHSETRSEAYYHICNVIDQASATNGHYRYHLKEPLTGLATRFDLKYWPSVSDCMRVIGGDAQSAEIVASDPLTEAATRSTRPSKADFLRALHASIEENRGDGIQAIPKKFRLSDDAMATLVNVLLKLPPQQLLSAEYVKNLRKRDNALMLAEQRRSAQSQSN